MLGESTGNNTNLALNFVPKMDPAILVEGYKSIMRTIYAPRAYYARVLECLKRVPQNEAEVNQYNLISSLISFARLTMRLGVLDAERREFWRFFVTAAAKHREKFVESMRMAAMGYHLRKLNEGFGDA